MKRLVLLFALGGVLPVWASSGGERLYAACIKCHGARGEGNPSGQGTQRGPKIGGQYAWYIETSLREFGKKIRTHPPSKPAIRGLSEQDIADLSAYIEGLK